MNLSDPVKLIPLVGDKYAAKLNNLGINTAEDLLHHYPARYEDFSNVKRISELAAGEAVTLQGTIGEIKNIYTSFGKRITRATLSDETGQIQLVWFNQPYLAQTLRKGSVVSLAGRLSEFDRLPAIIGPEYEFVNKSPPLHSARLVPHYPETRGVTSKWLRSRINFLLNTNLDIKEYLPKSIINERNFYELKDALRKIHFPQSLDEAEESRRRLSFDELFLLQIAALKRRNEWRERSLSKKFDIDNKRNLIDEFIKSLPFELTNAQKKAIEETLTDLKKDLPMNRLLEGDVGSGKTIVAAVGMYTAHLNGYQSVLMAPTEILAEQHYTTIASLFEPLKIPVALNTGAKKTAPSESMTIGTHALLYNKDEFENLGLVVIDEQHRFGVEQRAKLLRKSEAPVPSAVEAIPHLLTTTATPIPRSLALTVYGDLDLSVLDEMPIGRKEITTWVVPNQKREAAYNWIHRQIGEGAERSRGESQPQKTQVYIICPLIEESEAETMQSVKAASKEFERLSSDVFPDLKLALLHGKIKSKEKNAILTDFKNGLYDILVSTQVVEVGIDIPTATIILIEGADRFGLASLHQLRGRVGRSDRQSYCLLFSESKNDKVFNRLKAMEELNNGFKLAEIDLKMRGPGEFFGVKQHGIMKLKLASLADVKLIETTRSEAGKVLENDPNLDKHQALKEKISNLSGEVVEPN